MTNRIATIVRAALLGWAVSCASNAGFAATNSTVPASDCLTGPKGAAPRGERWYYRVERNTKRHCWYTRASTGRDVASKAIRPEATPTDISANIGSDAQLQPAVANARAELTQMRDSSAPSSVVPQPAITTSAADSNSAPAQDAAPANTTLAERWSDSAADQSNPPATKALAQPPSRAGATDTENTPLWILLSMIGGVLALVGVVTALIKTFAGSAKYSRPDHRRAAPRWPVTDQRPEPLITPVDDAPLVNLDVPPMNWVRIARETSHQQDDEIERLLSHRTRPAT